MGVQGAANGGAASAAGAGAAGVAAGCGCGCGAAGGGFPAAPDYRFYLDEYGGELGAEEYAFALTPALRHVRWLVGGDVHAEGLTEAELLALKRAVCAAAEAFAEWGEGQTGGFTLGSFSVKHYDNRGTTGAEQATAAAVAELCATDFAFCGCAR